jgi:hypothetical protein
VRIFRMTQEAESFNLSKCRHSRKCSWNGDARLWMGSQNDGGWIKHQQGDVSSDPPWRCAQSSPHTDPRARSNGDSHQAKVSSRRVKTIPCSLYWILSFLRWKLLSKERGFRMLNTLRNTWRQNWTLFLQRPMLTVFKNFLNDATMYSSGRRLLWTVIKQFFISVYFYVFFHTSPGTLMPHLVWYPKCNLWAKCIIRVRFAFLWLFNDAFGIKITWRRMERLMNEWWIPRDFEGSSSSLTEVQPRNLPGGTE